MDTTWLINGSPGLIAPDDRGFAYGDGLFETMAVVDGRIRHFERHFSRLRAGCRRLGIPAPDERSIVGDLDAAGALPDRCVAKLILSRGRGGRGYRPLQDPIATRAFGIHPWPNYPTTHYSTGVAVRICEMRLAENPALAGIKHLNRLEQVIARLEWDDDDVAEGLMLDGAGRVVSGTMTNLFLVRGATLVTPNLRRCGVAGVMRSVVMELAARLEIGIVETDVSSAELGESDEIFLTNAIAGIWPVRQAGTRAFGIGATTRQLMGLLEDASHE